MNTTEITTAWTVRETDPRPGVAATIDGLAAPYGVETDTGAYRESFAPDAFDPADVVGKPLCWRHGDPIGVITDAVNREDGLFVSADIADTTMGRDAATLLRQKAVTGLSVGFDPIVNNTSDKPGVIKRVKAALLELSLTHKPAYATAGVGVVREETPMSVQTIEETPVVSTEAEPAVTREELVAVQRQLAAIGTPATTEAAHPLSEYRSLGEYVKAVRTGTEDRALNVSALSEQTGLVTPNWLSDIKGVLDRGRPCINALGGPTSAADVNGLTLYWPSFTGDLTAIVAAQANENDEVNSADIDIVTASAALATYASGNRLTYQVIERTSPSYVTAHMRILMGAYGTETDYAFQNALWANDTYGGVDYDFSADTTGQAFIEAVWNAAIACEDATGEPAEVVYVNTAVFAKLAAWSSFQAQNYPHQNTGGVFNAATLRASVLGLPIVRAKEFATDESEDAIVTNRAAVAWAEDGPRFAQAEQAANLGRDVAIYGYGVTTPFITAGIVSIYNHA